MVWLAKHKKLASTTSAQSLLQKEIEIKRLFMNCKKLNIWQNDNDVNRESIN